MIFFSLIAGSIVDRVTHAKVMAIGAITMAISITAFSTAIYLPEKWQIITLGIGLRLL